MKKLFLLGLGLLALGITLVVLHDRSRTPEARRIAAAKRLQLGAPAEFEIEIATESLDGHFQIVNPQATLEGVDAGRAWPLRAEAAFEKTWGEKLTIRTRERNGAPYRIANLYSMSPRVRVVAPTETNLTGRWGVVVVSGTVVYPTATPGAKGYTEESVRFNQRFEVIFVATAAETSGPFSLLGTAGTVAWVGGVLVLALVFILALVRSAHFSDESTQPSFRTVGEAQNAVAQGGRYVQFQYAVSVVILTFRNRSGVYFIPAGGRTFFAGFKWTVLSLFMGWWGFPWGPIYTIGALVTNSSGGVNVTATYLDTMTRNALAKAPPPLPPGASLAPASNAAPPPLPPSAGT